MVKNSTDKQSKESLKRHGRAILRVSEDEQVRYEHLRRWPTQYQEQVYADMNRARGRAGRRRPGAKRIKPRQTTFPLLHEIKADVLDKLLTASSLKLKQVRRDPGFVLIRQYHLKNRPLVFI